MNCTATRLRTRTHAQTRIQRRSGDSVLLNYLYKVEGEHIKRRKEETASS